MKILILTQPLHNNYGGILQAYALQTVLKRMGHDVATDSKPHGNTSVIRRIVKVIKRIILKYVLKKDIDVSVLKPRRNISIIKYTVRVIQRIIFKYALRKDVDVSVFSLFLSPAKGWNIINRHTLRFVKENISTVDFFKGRKKPDIRTVKAYDAIIVGSDQVWRKQFSDVSAHLLDFTKGMNVKRIAYAASFGMDDLSEYGTKLIKHTAKLAKRFDAISVREDSGVVLCKKYWNVEAVHLLDPTLLLDRNDYIRLVEQDNKNIAQSQGSLFVYVLDRTAEKQQIVNRISSTLHLSSFEILPEKTSFPENLKELDNQVYPPVTQWVQSFIDAKFIVTDSFHGTVFSILFNKPFIVTVNKTGGLARLSSLLRIFNLENRLVSSFDELTDEIISDRVEWNHINNIISGKRKESVCFLSDNLVIRNK